MSDIVEECAFIVRLLRHAISTTNNFLKLSPHTFKDTYICICWKCCLGYVLSTQNVAPLFGAYAAYTQSYTQYCFVYSRILFYSRLIGNPIKELSGKAFLYNKRLDAL